MCEEIIQKVTKIIENIIEREIPLENCKKNLFSDAIGIKPFEMVYIFFQLEMHFDVLFLPKEICDEEFTSIEKISELILKKRNIALGHV